MFYWIGLPITKVQYVSLLLQIFVHDTLKFDSLKYFSNKSTFLQFKKNDFQHKITN